MTKQAKVFQIIRKETASKASVVSPKKPPVDNPGTKLAEALEKIKQADELLRGS